MTQSVNRPVQTETEIPGPRQSAETLPEAATPVAEAAAPPPGDPAIIGLPAFIVGSVALALVQINFAPLAATGAAIPIIATATTVGLFIAAVWAARLGQSLVASIMGVFAGFWLSYAAVSIGLGHAWWAIVSTGVARSVEVFLIAWLVVMGLLTLATLRLPIVYPVLMVLVDLALVLLLIATVQASVSMTKTAGWVVLAFAAVGGYLWLSSLSVAAGGRALPMGPVLVT
jgi:succinate-acetate transporter protein